MLLKWKWRPGGGGRHGLCPPGGGYIREHWSKSIERMRAHGTIGVLYVESRKLKNSLLPITEQFLDHLERELNVLARERCKSALNDYKRIKAPAIIMKLLFSLYIHSGILWAGNYSRNII